MTGSMLNPLIKRNTRYVMYKIFNTLLHTIVIDVLKALCKSAMLCLETSSHVMFSTHCFPFFWNSWYFFVFPTNFIASLAISCGELLETTTPVLSCWTTSRRPKTLYTTDGVQTYAASSTTNPHPSLTEPWRSICARAIR